ncbi:MAG TPA: DUF305 domain-containing protein [Candidatus Nanopelagicales bacterium]|nr:DUF305 domain-containing protein [Candidatus Nanopelagicales bacterium]
MRKKTIAVTALAIAGTLTLAGCGGSTASHSGMSGMESTSTPTSTGSTAAMSDFNDADVTFATGMIPHHRQAVEMAKLADTRAKSPQVKALAMQIMNAQDPEIRTMSNWLTTWGKPVPSDHSSMSGMDMSSSGSMPGMMSGADMDKLKKATGADFDQMFLTMMIAHHQGAIEMANTEKSSGMNADAIALAQQIEEAQTTEITTMQGLLK